MTDMDHIFDHRQSRVSTGESPGIDSSVKDAYPCQKGASSRVDKYSEGWSLSFTNDKLTKITYPNGKHAEISYVDDEVIRVKLPDNTAWVKKSKYSAGWYEGNIKNLDTFGSLVIYDDGRIETKNWKTAHERTWYADGSIKLGAPDLGGEFKRLYLSALPQIDANKDGKLSKTEIKNAILNPSVKGNVARFASVAHRCFDNLSSLTRKYPGHDATINKGDIDTYDAYTQKTTDRWNTLLDNLNPNKNNFETVYQKFIATDERNRHRNLYSRLGAPHESIQSKFVNQGSLGDCYFHAAVASIADARPDLIEKMIHDNKDGTYTITFAGSPNQPLRIKSLTESEKMLYGSSTEGGLWPLLIEKAYGEQLRNEYSNMGLGILVNDMLPYQLTNIPGQTERVSDKLTGQKHETMFVPTVSDDVLSAQLQSAYDQHIPMTCGTRLTDIRPHPQGLETQHAYSILSYDHEKQLVTIRNPHGMDDENYKGTFQMSLKQFKENFTDIYFAWRPKQRN